MNLSIYNKSGNSICRVHKLEYVGKFMGERYVNVSVESPEPIVFTIGCYLNYRGERFELNVLPSVTKNARRNTANNSFVYDNIKFNSLSDELTRCVFLDVVLEDNQIHYTALPNFSFYCNNVKDLADRLQANLDRTYGKNTWNISVVSYGDVKNKNISVSTQNCWNALALVNSEFDLDFTIKGRNIYIGKAGNQIGHEFQYGKGNGLLNIERTVDTNQAIVTRLRAYGNTTNMPSRYYAKKYGSEWFNNYAVTHLMLPSFSATNKDPYIDSANIEELGVREATVFFDGSNDLEDIYPTMEGMTDASGNRLDVIVSADQITDDGIYPYTDSNGKEITDIPTFKLTIPDVGFDINDYLSEESASISFKDGMCGGREFTIVGCTKNTDNTYTLELNRVEDSSLELYFPYKDYNIKAGDHYVLLNISMPDVYIERAAAKLQTAAEEYLAKNCLIQYTYTPKIDNIFMQRDHDSKVNKAESIYYTIYEGDVFKIDDYDLGIVESISIDTLTIKEDSSDSSIPQFSVTLKQDKEPSLIERIQSQIANSVSGTKLTGDYISRVSNDTAHGKITFDKGIASDYIASKQYSSGELGSGFAISKYGNTNDSYMEIDRLLVRKFAYFMELVIKKLSHVGGSIILSPASMKCTNVEDSETYYKCYFANTDGDKTIYNEFVVGDLARSQTFRIDTGTNKMVSNDYYWREVVAVGDDYICLSKVTGKYDTGSTIPKIGDDIVLCGNRTDTARQNVLMLSSYGANAPYFKMYQKVNAFSLEGKECVDNSYNTEKGRMIFKVLGDFYFGNSAETNYVKYDQEGGLHIKAKELSFSTSSGEDKNINDVYDLIEDSLEAFDNSFEIHHLDTNDEPSLTNEPAKDWNTQALKEQHVGDFAILPNGLCYKFEFDGNQFLWSAVSDKYLLDTTSRLNNIAADGILSKDEKVAEKKKFDELTEEYTAICANIATNYPNKEDGTSTKPTTFSAYQTAYTALKNEMDIALADMSSDYEMQFSGSTNLYTSKWLAYYRAKANLEAEKVQMARGASEADLAAMQEAVNTFKVEVQDILNNKNNAAQGYQAFKTIFDSLDDMSEWATTDAENERIKGYLKATDDFTFLGNAGLTVKKDSNGKWYVEKINSSGVVTESNYASLFSNCMTSNNVITTANISTYSDEKGAAATIDAKYSGADGLVKNAIIKAIANGDFSKIELSADQIDFDAAEVVRIAAKLIKFELKDSSGKVTQTYTLDDLITVSSSGGAGIKGGVSGRLETAAGQVLIWTDGVLTSAGFEED